jgi:hypothetical protein
MENPRTTTARDTDDHELIEGAIEEGAPSFGSAGGGQLQRNVASAAEEKLIAEPDGTRRVEKADAIEEDQARPTQRPRD